ncbi:hypothetical protein ACPV5J_19085 [Vibrio rotiferianus]|uniref:hypothetical protein n=1 Tax=Vibrio rotiferianus TaxID=190895 RepID=UPI00406A525D
MTKLLSIQECNQALDALNAADKLSSSIQKELSNLENIDTQDLIKKAGKMLLTGNFSLEAIGLSPEIFNQVKALEQISATARNKYRERVEADKTALEAAQEVDNG